MPLTDLEALVIEWREARKAFLAADHSQPSTYETRKPLFDRLANAECALAKPAEPLPPASTATITFKPCPDCGGNSLTCECLPW